MPNPTCPKCASTHFELQRISVQHSTTELFGVCCSSCGAVISTLPRTDTNYLIEQLAKKLNVKLY